ncbi:MAG: hypothetical protein NDJ90_03640 [Oligoflexia bacterium]|nr:hypothetical protein [Oligoflexia bacterium]
MKSAIFAVFVVLFAGAVARAETVTFVCKSPSTELTYEARMETSDQGSFGEIEVFRGNESLWYGDGYGVQLERTTVSTKYSFVFHEDGEIDLVLWETGRKIRGAFRSDPSLSAGDLMCRRRQGSGA